MFLDMSVLDPVTCCAPLTASVLSDDEANATAELFKALGGGWEAFEPHATTGEQS